MDLAGVLGSDSRSDGRSYGGGAGYASSRAWCEALLLFFVTHDSLNKQAYQYSYDYRPKDDYKQTIALSEE